MCIRDRANCEKMNQLVKVIITYDFADRTETVDRTLIKNWFGYDEDGNVILDENLVRQYVADLGLKYDTMGPVSYTHLGALSLHFKLVCGIICDNNLTSQKHSRLGFFTASFQDDR